MKIKNMIRKWLGIVDPDTVDYDVIIEDIKKSITDDFIIEAIVKALNEDRVTMDGRYGVVFSKIQCAMRNVVEVEGKDFFREQAIDVINDFHHRIGEVKEHFESEDFLDQIVSRIKRKQV